MVEWGGPTVLSLDVALTADGREGDHVYRRPDRFFALLRVALSAAASFATSSAAFFATRALTRFSRFGPPVVSMPSSLDVDCTPNAAAAASASAVPMSLWFADRPLLLCTGCPSDSAAAFLLEPEIIGPGSPECCCVSIADGVVIEQR